MELGAALLAAAERGWPAGVEEFRAAIDPAWITSALAASGRSTVRRRKLPGELVVWLVIAMALFRNRRIADVVHHLGLVIPHPDGMPARVSNAAIVQARDRVGPEPLAALFGQLAIAWAGAEAADERWRDLAVYGVDGTTLRVPDTAENDAEFGRPGASRGNAAAAYPQVRLVVLLRLRSRLLTAAALGAYTDSEKALSDPLWRTLPAHSLVVLDRGFASYALFHRLHDAASGRHWLIRARSGPWALKWQVVERRGRDDQLVDLAPSRGTRDAHPTLAPTLRARAVHVRRRGFRPYVVLTSLLDATQYPAAEIAALYHDRWELELAFDEVKTHTLERLETLRSKAPARIRQEVWGLLIAYNLVRYLLVRAAPRAHVTPRALGYRHALVLVQNFLLTVWGVAAGTVPRHLDQLLDDLALGVLPARRERRYPRAVKIKMSNYPRKRPSRRRRCVK
jgi:transposase IS4-like protein/DDE family transposase